MRNNISHPWNRLVFYMYSFGPIINIPIYSFLATVPPQPRAPNKRPVRLKTCSVSIVSVVEHVDERIHLKTLFVCRLPCMCSIAHPRAVSTVSHCRCDQVLLIVCVCLNSLFFSVMWIALVIRFPSQSLEVKCSWHFMAFNQPDLFRNKQWTISPTQMIPGKLWVAPTGSLRN